VSWFNDFIGPSSQENKPGPQKLANIIDRLTPALEVLLTVKMNKKSTSMHDNRLPATQFTGHFA